MKRSKEKLLVKVKPFLMLFLLISILSSCGGKQKEDDAPVDAPTPDSIISYTKSYSDTLCSKWALEKADILHFIMEFDTISGYEWHNCYGSFECKIEGKVRLDDQMYFYSVNAGGWIRVWDEGHEIFLGSTTPVIVPISFL